MYSVKPSDVADVIVSAALFVAMVCFLCMLGIAAQIAFAYTHRSLSEGLIYLATITAVVLAVTLMLAREIAKLLPLTAGRTVFQFKKKKD